MRLCLALLFVYCAAAQSPPRAQREPPPREVIVEGVLKDAATELPIQRATISGRRIRPNGAQLPWSQITDPDGRFRGLIQAGDRLLLQAAAAGYVEDVDSSARGDIEVVSTAGQPGQSMMRVTLRLHRTAEIAGSILDVDAPVPGVKVQAHLAFYESGKRRLRPVGDAAVTNPQGQFSIGNLPPAPYFLEVVQAAEERIEPVGIPRRPPAEVYTRLYWPGEGAVDDAQPIPLASGARLALGPLRIRKERFVKVRGRLLTPLPGSWAACRLLLWDRRYRYPQLRDNLMMSCNSPFTVHNLAPGRWTLEAVQLGASPERTHAALAELQLKDEDGEAEIRLQLPLVVPVQIKGVNALPPAAPVLIRRGLPELVPMKEPSPVGVGEFRLPAPVTDLAEVVLPRLGSAYCVKEIRYNGGITDDGHVEFNRQALRQALEIYLSDRPARLTGTVMDGNRPAAGAHLVVAEWPGAVRAEWPKTRRLQCDGDGRFDLGGLPAAAYRVFAVPWAQRLRLEEPGVLLHMIGRAEQHQLNEGGSEAIRVRLVEP